jgi:hypothetical protein
MINSLIAYDTAELEKKKVLSEAENLYKSKVLSEAQWLKISEEFASKLYTPSLFMRVLLFIFSLIGMSTIIGPIAAIIGSTGRWGHQIISLFIGISIVFFLESVLIKRKGHFNSGITEAGIYSGLSFIAFGLLGSNTDNVLLIQLTGFILATFAAIRYLNLTALVLMIVFFCWLLFRIMSDIGGVAEALLPFVFMAVFGLIYGYSIKLQKKYSNVIFENQFVVIKMISLILVYLSGNYFVVRELSIRLMGLNLTGADDIPFAFLFYMLTALVPFGYLYWGIRQKSILLIRISLLTIALSAVTFKYYFSLGSPVLIITLSGFILIILSLISFKYLKQIRGGFTRELLLNDKWHSPDLASFVASQTLGGNRISEPVSDDTIFNGGRFGGGGAGETW